MLQKDLEKSINYIKLELIHYHRRIKKKVLSFIKYFYYYKLFCTYFCLL